jgi:hypothetical protein
MVLVASASSPWPTVTDDDGTGQTGTVWNNAFDASCQATLNALLHSSTNTTLTPKAIIDEVVTARGSKANLDARLDVVLNEDGTLKTQDTLATVTDLQAQLGARNLVQNDDLAGWQNGAASAPDNFTLAGGGAAVARTGSGEADTYSFLAGQYSAKLTYGAATVTLSQDIVSSSDFSNYTKARSKAVAFGMWGKTSVANALSIVIDDGVTTTRGGQAGNGTYHTGGGTEEWLYGTHTLSASATKITIYAELAQNTTGYVGGFALIFSSEEMTFWPPFSTIGYATASKAGTVSISAQSFEGVKNFKAPPTLEPGTGSGTAVIGGCLSVNTTTVTVGTGVTAETDLMTYSLPANTLSANGKAVRVTAYLRRGGSGGTCVFKAYFGAGVLTGANTGTGVNQQVVEFWIIRTGSNAQKLLCGPLDLDTFGTHVVGTATETDSGAVTIKFTCTMNTADQGFQDAMIVEVVN